MIVDLAVKSKLNAATLERDKALFWSLRNQQPLARFRLTRGKES